MPTSWFHSRDVTFMVLILRTSRIHSPEPDCKPASAIPRVIRAAHPITRTFWPSWDREPRKSYEFKVMDTKGEMSRNSAVLDSSSPWCRGQKYHAETLVSSVLAYLIRELRELPPWTCTILLNIISETWFPGIINAILEYQSRRHDRRNFLPMIIHPRIFISSNLWQLIPSFSTRTKQ